MLHSPATSLNVTALQGLTDGTSPTAGQAGEPLSSLISSPTTWPVTGSPSTWGNMTSKLLTKGNWLIKGGVQIINNGATLAGAVVVAISVNSDTTTTDHVGGVNEGSFTVSASGTAPRTYFIPDYYLSLNADTTVYLKTNLAFTVATPNYQCGLVAIRQP